MRSLFIFSIINFALFLFALSCSICVPFSHSFLSEIERKLMFILQLEYFEKEKHPDLIKFDSNSIFQLIYPATALQCRQGGLPQQKQLFVYIYIFIYFKVLK